MAAEIDPMETGDLLRDWNAREYLEYYYAHTSVPDDEAVMFRFIAQGLRNIGRRFDAGLEIGCGPVLHHAAQLVPWVDRLDMADVQEANLEEIRRWIRRDRDAFDWSVFLGAENGALDAEGRGGSLAEREALLRARIQLLRGDLRDSLPLGVPVQYPLVACYYCAEWVVPTIPGWHETMRKVTSLVSPGGWLFLAGVHATDYCMISGRRVSCARVTEDDLRRVLDDLGFDASTVRLDVTPGQRPSVSGIQGTFMGYAQRTRWSPAIADVRRRAACGSSMALTSATEVLDFWFSDRARALWFASHPAFDDEVRSRFGRVVPAAASGELDPWIASGDGALALTIVLDQFPRNMYRGSARAFETDSRAREVAGAAIASQLELTVALDRRMFFYLPFEHSESLLDQDRSVELFSRWALAHPEPQRRYADDQMIYVLRHHEIIRRFGRFPHRNAVLGRASTPAEIAFLGEPRSSF